jgi:CubicO group peptidase (beta-lactamase class C family)
MTVFWLVILGMTLWSCEKSEPETPDPDKEIPATPDNGEEDDDDPDPDSKTYRLTVSERVLNFSAFPAIAQTIAITSNTGWQITIEQTGNWLSVSPLQGNGDGAVSVTAAVNAGNARTAIITISGTGVSSKAIVVSQEKTSSDNALQSVTFTSVNSGITATVSGIFNNRIIYATLPDGVDIRQLKISFSIPSTAKMLINDNEESSPSSPIDCSGVVNLKVRAANGSDNAYTLLVKNGNKTIDDKLYAFMKTYSIPGISVSVMKNEAIIYSHGFGLADADGKIRVTPDHLFRLASVSKQFTAVCIMKLVQDGLLNIDQNVFGAGGILNAEYPGVTGEKATVTPRHFLQHRSGWTNGYDPMFYYGSLDAAINYILFTRDLTSAPGTAFSYYNTGYSILGRIIEKISGKSYEQYLKELLLSADINDIHVGGDTRAQRRSNEVLYYSQDSGDNGNYDMQMIAAMGGLIASTPQLMRFLASFDGLSGIPDILNPASRSEMFTPVQASNGWYALGWRMKHSALFPGGYYHDGNLAGTAAMWCGGVTGGYSAALLCNSRSYISGFDTAMYVLLDEIVDNSE